MAVAASGVRDARSRSNALARRVGSLAAAPAAVSPAAVARDVLSAVLDLVPAPGGALLLMHPQTGLFWSGAVTGLPAATCHPFFSVEVASTSTRTFRRLAQTGARGGPLSAWRGGDDALRTTVLEPFGYSDELRCVCRDGATAWAGISLWRTEGTFTASDQMVLDEVSDPIGGLLREAVLRALENPAGQPDRGLLVVDDEGVVEASAEGTRFLRELSDPTLQDYRHLDHLLAMARSDPSFSAVLGTRDGGWVTAHGMALGSGKVAISLAEASPADLLGARVAGAGLTGREIEVTRLLCKGLSDGEIARAIGVSPHTARDHVKAVRRKLGLRSRNEVTALVFEDRYFQGFLDNAVVSHGSTA